jgi:hypothetical protein
MIEPKVSNCNAYNKNSNPNFKLYGVELDCDLMYYERKSIR